MPYASPRDKPSLQDILVFLVLVGIGVAGRWGQPDWCFTPTAAIGIFAGFYFRPLWTALLVPLAVLGITDLALPAYDSRGVMVAVHVALALPVFFGRTLRSSSGRRSDSPRASGLVTAAKLGLCGLAPATLFFLISNWAVWQFQSDYASTLGGLANCYAAAVPFYRAMLAGDIFYVLVLLGCYVVSVAYLRRPGHSAVGARQPAEAHHRDQ